MVTALGIDVRKAFTLVFAIGGVAAALAGVLSGVYYTTIDPNQGTNLLIFAFIVVVIGGLGSITGSAIAAVVVGLLAAVRELLRDELDRRLGPRRPLGAAAARGRAARAPARPRGSGRGVSRRVVADFVWPLAVFGALAFVPRIGAAHPEALRLRDLEPGNAAAAGALPALRRARAHVRPAVRLHRAAVVRARALRRDRRVHDEHRDHRLALELRAGAALHGGARLRRPARARHDLASRRRHRVRDGDARVRAGGRGARAQGPAPLDARGGGPRRRLHEASGLLRRHLQHEVPLLARARIPRRRLLHRALVGRVVARPRVAGDPRERAARRGARPAPARVQADGVRARVVPRDRGRRRLHAALQQHEPGA